MKKENLRPVDFIFKKAPITFMIVKELKQSLQIIFNQLSSMLQR